MNQVEYLYERLAGAASLETDDGAIRIRAEYEPGAGAQAKVSPPVYPTDGRETPYVVEERLGTDGARETTVLLDSRQSQANRCEEALQEAIDRGDLGLPHLALEVGTHDQEIRITSLTAPHRSRDSYFRDSQAPDGTPFDRTDQGRELVEATALDATPLYRYSPSDLVYGVWDSHRNRRLQTKYPRVYTSEMTGRDAVVGLRAAGRYDMYTSGARRVSGNEADWQVDDKGKGKLSELGLGSIPPAVGAAGGVTVRSIEREATLSFAGLARIRAGRDEGQRRAGRAVLASLALVGDRLAFGSPSLFLRSGCDLILVSEQLSWVGRGGAEEPLDLDAAGARELFRFAVERARAVGLDWDGQPLRLMPQAKLQRVIDEAFLSAPAEQE